MSDEYVHFNNNTQPAINEDNLNRMQQLIKQDINGAVAGDTLPLGAMIPFPGGTIPTNYLLCDGSAVSRTTYASLFNVIGTTYGEGDGSTTFNLPDMRLRTAVGVDTRDSDLNAVGKTYGEKTHTLTQNQLPVNMIDTSNSGSNTDGYIARAGYTKTGSYNFGGLGQPFDIMQPSMATNYIIKAFQTAGVVAEVVNARNNSQTKVYSTSYINNIADYSTTEKVCGTWIDGKPLYRKVLVTTWGDREASSQNISVSDLNIDTMVNMTGKVSYSNGWHAIGGYANANFYSLIQYNYREYNIQCYGKGYTNADLVIILEYTKTTD